MMSQVWCGEVDVTDAVLASLKHEALISWLREHPEVSLHMLRALAQRLRRANDVTADLVFTDVPGRVAKNLLDLADRFGNQEADGLHVHHDQPAPPCAPSDGGEVMPGHGRYSLREDHRVSRPPAQGLARQRWKKVIARARIGNLVRSRTALVRLLLNGSGDVFDYGLTTSVSSTPGTTSKCSAGTAPPPPWSRS